MIVNWFKINYMFEFEIYYLEILNFRYISKEYNTIFNLEMFRNVSKL